MGCHVETQGTLHTVQWDTMHKIHQIKQVGRVLESSGPLLNFDIDAFLDEAFTKN